MPTLDLKKYLLAGLSNDWRKRVNQPGLSTGRGLRSCPFGALSFWPFTGPSAAYFAAATPAITPSFPYPYIFTGRHNILLMMATKLYTISRSDATCVEQTVYDWDTWDWDDDSATSTTIANGARQWDFAEVGAGFILTDGTQVLFKTPFSTKIFKVTMVIESLADYKGGRIFMGGFSPTDGIWDDFEDWIDADETDLPDRLKGLYAGLGGSHVSWTGAGAGDLWGLFNFDYLKYGWFDNTKNTGFDGSTRAYYDDVLSERNSAGNGIFSHGDVLRLVPFRETMVAFQSDSITPLWPHEGAFSTFAPQNKSANIHTFEGMDRGLAALSRTAIAAHDDLLAFVDIEYALNMITPDGRHERVDYSKHLSPIASGLHLSYNSSKKELWLTNGTRAYCLPKDGGMMESPLGPSSIGFFKAPTSIWFEMSSHDDVSIKTLPFTAGHPEIGGEDGQTMALVGGRIVTLNAASTIEWQVRAVYQMAMTEAESNGPWETINPDGTFTLGRLPAAIASIELQHAERTRTHGIEGLTLFVTVGGPYGSRTLHDASAPSTVTVPTP